MQVHVLRRIGKICKIASCFPVQVMPPLLRFHYFIYFTTIPNSGGYDFDSRSSAGDGALAPARGRGHRATHVALLHMAAVIFMQRAVLGSFDATSSSQSSNRFGPCHHQNKWRDTHLARLLQPFAAPPLLAQIDRCGAQSRGKLTFLAQ